MSSKRSQLPSSPKLLRHTARYGLASLLLGGTFVATGCLDRPIGESTPVTTNVVIQKQANNAITGIDLLLMIDNSSSMADKQEVLSAAVPQLLSQLVEPNCVDDSGNPYTPNVTSQIGVNPPCTQGTPEFNPVNNIHIAIVTSSLGDHGQGEITGETGTCTPGAATPYEDPNNTSQTLVQPADVNDEGRLVGTLARFTAAYPNPAGSTYADLDPQGFLAWGNSKLPTGVGLPDLTAATTIFQDMVTATNESGCGFEAQLEGWFRFLIDPVPPVLPLPAPVGSWTSRIGSDDTLLAQRAVFLRPDSLVAIIMLTDENDCSIRDTDVGWVSDQLEDANHNPTPIASGSSQCQTNPNDKCCYSCTTGAPGGCTAGCTAGKAGVDDGEYQPNIRCWQQKRRFGYEFLYPKSRYVVGMTQKVLCPDQSYGDMDCNCTYANKIGASCDPTGGKGGTPRQMPNPLYSVIAGQKNDGSQISQYPNSIPRSDNSAIFLAGIVGVPWQDIGTTDATGNLVYVPVTDPAWTSGTAPGATLPANPPTGSAGIWDMIYGDDNANIMPQDMHMVESIVPRAAGQNVDGQTTTNIIPNTPPWSSQTMQPTTAAPTADPFNGHEWNTALEDLEYACIAQLTTTKPCPCTASSATFNSCVYLHPNDCCSLSYTTDALGNPGADYDKPLCQPPGGGAQTTTQYFFKGYPGLREIAVLHDYAVSTDADTQGNSIVASICPKDLSAASQTANSPGYGYNPAVAALITRLKEKLKGSCLPRPLQPNADGSLPCNVVEVVSGANLTDPTTGSPVDCTTYCTANQRGTPSPQMTAAVVTSLQQSRVCDVSGGPACNTFCQCLLPQEPAGNDLTVCQNATDGSENTTIPPGYCYIDATLGIGNADLVAKCPATERRILRFVGNNPSGGGVAVPLPGSIIFTACQGSALGTTTATPVGDAGNP